MTHHLHPRCTPVPEVDERMPSPDPAWLTPAMITSSMVIVYHSILPLLPADLVQCSVAFGMGVPLQQNWNRLALARHIFLLTLTIPTWLPAAAPPEESCMLTSWATLKLQDSQSI